MGNETRLAELEQLLALLIKIDAARIIERSANQGWVQEPNEAEKAVAAMRKLAEKAPSPV